MLKTLFLLLFVLNLHANISPTTTYSYDDKNRLIKAQTPNDTVEFEYDANDNRIAKIINGETTTYLIDTNTPLCPSDNGV